MLVYVVSAREYRDDYSPDYYYIVRAFKSYESAREYIGKLQDRRSKAIRVIRKAYPLGRFLNCVQFSDNSENAGALPLSDNSHNTGALRPQVKSFTK